MRKTGSAPTCSTSAAAAVARDRPPANLAHSPGPFSGVLPEALAQLDDATLARMETDLTRLIGLLDADEASAGLPLASM